MHIDKIYCHKLNVYIIVTLATLIWSFKESTLAFSTGEWGGESEVSSGALKCFVTMNAFIWSIEDPAPGSDTRGLLGISDLVLMATGELEYLGTLTAIIWSLDKPDSKCDTRGPIDLILFFTDLE